MLKKICSSQNLIILNTLLNCFGLSQTFDHLPRLVLQGACMMWKSSRSSFGREQIFWWLRRHIQVKAQCPPPPPPPTPAPACHNGSQSWARPLLPSHYHTLSSRVNNLILIPILVHLLLPHPCPDPNLISTKSWIDSFWTFGDLTGQLDLNWAQSVDRPLETSGNGWNPLNIHYMEVSLFRFTSIER